MMKKLFFGLLMMTPLALAAQLTISVQLPPAGFVQKDQLWNLILVNSKDELLDVSIRMSLQDRVTGNVVLSCNSGSVLMGKGVKIVNARDIQPLQYNFSSADFAKDYLPVGTYIACYQVYHNVGERQVPLGDECTQINIDPLSPPLLNTPADKSMLPTPYPQFTWMPPTPFDMFSNLNYDLIVTEVLPGQTAAESIQSNLPVYSRHHIFQTTESYPSSFTKLDTGKVYAWQVIANNGINYSAKTEIWTFQLEGTTAPVPTPQYDTYILLQKNLTGTYVISNKDLHIKYYSYNSPFTATITFTDIDGKVVKTVEKKIAAGNNYFDLKLNSQFKPGNIYQVSIVDQENKKHFISFTTK